MHHLNTSLSLTVQINVSKQLFPVAVLNKLYCTKWSYCDYMELNPRLLSFKGKLSSGTFLRFCLLCLLQCMSCNSTQHLIFLPNLTSFQ